MAEFEVSLAAADAVIDRDFFRDRSEVKFSSVPRRIAAIGMAGSAAGNDTVAELKVGNTKVADVRNVTTGNPTNDHMKPLDQFVPVGAPIGLVILDAAATNPVIVRIVIEELA